MRNVRSYTRSGQERGEEAGVNRRTFFRVSAAAAGGMLVSMYFDSPVLAQQPPASVYPPDAFVHIKPDGRIVITINRCELGQGVATALSMILADEMDADWSHVACELAPAADIYKDPVYGFQNTGGSATIANSFQQYRELGAKTRAMLIATAADRWHVSRGDCRAAKSVVFGPDGHSVRYAELADEAARRPVPGKVDLKTPSEFQIIGKPTPRLDSRAKCDGSQKFGLDLDLPGMLIALVARPPVFGGRVKAFDDREARSLPGVREVFEISRVRGTGVAVVADRFWTAKQARDRLKIDWDLSGIEHEDSAELSRRYKELARTPGNVAVNRGDATVLDRVASENRILAEYEFPYLAHTPMEPLNATVRFDGDRAEVWVPSQFPTFDQAAVAEVLGLKAAQVTFHIEYAGGGFGRRQSFDSHVPREAAAIAKTMRGTPVKVVWTREDDVQGGYYRPMFVHRVEIGIGDDGTPIAWKHVVVGQSYVMGTPFESYLVKNGVDFDAVTGTADMPYSVPNLQVTAQHPTVNVPAAQWRSIGSTHNAFVMETLIDELATRANADPIAYRLKLIKPEAKRLRAALALLDEKSAWRKRVPAGQAVGIASNEYQGTAAACAAEVSMEGKRARIHRVTVAVHCGLAVNPLSIESQFQGGIVFGLTQIVAKGAITLRDGRVEQRNFDGFAPPYIADAPAAIDVHIVPSTEAPTGTGEPPVPLIAPAVVNALFRLTGQRFRTLPLA
jgi:isoquinoline 1-oxidoreductase subunit beta